MPRASLKLPPVFNIRLIAEATCESFASLKAGKRHRSLRETAGTEITAQQTIHMAKKGSTIVFVGYGKSGMMNLPMSLALDKELTLKTIFR